MHCTVSRKVDNEFDSDNTIDNLIKWVRNVESQDDAIENAKIILLEYHKRMPFWKKLS